MLAVLLSLVVSTSSACSWDHPGVNPYKNMTSEPATALRDYAMPATTRAKLKDRMEHVHYDEVVTITRDKIVGTTTQYTDMRDMHSGHGQFCKGVVTRNWDPARVEVGLVYCEDHVCVIVPTICNNVSLVTRKDDEEPIDIAPAAGHAAGGGKMGAAPPAADTTPVAGLDETPMTPQDPVTTPPIFLWGGDMGGGYGYIPVGGVGGGGTGSPSGPGGGGTGGGTGGTPGGPGGSDGPGGGDGGVPPIITPPVAVPEPASWLLMAPVMFLLMLRRRHWL